MRVLNVIALILILIGGLAWGLIGVFNYNIVEAIFGTASTGASVTYIIIGIAALYKTLVAIAVRTVGSKK